MNKIDNIDKYIKYIKQHHSSDDITKIETILCYSNKKKASKNETEQLLEMDVEYFPQYVLQFRDTGRTLKYKYLKYKKKYLELQNNIN